MSEDQKKPVVMITFREDSHNGGPYNSHLRILKSKLSKSYNFVPLIIPKGPFKLLNLKIIYNIYRQISLKKPDIVHLAGLQLEGFHAVLACKVARTKKTVVAIHGSSTEARDFPKWKKKIIKILEILTLRLSSAAYGVSDYVSKWDLIHYSKHYFGTIYNLSQKNVLCCGKAAIRKEFNIDINDILIVSTGRITVEKGFQILLDIILEYTIPRNVKFLIIGDGAYLETMKKLLVLHSKQDSVIFPGYRDDIDNFLKESDIFIMPSLHETLCMSVLEACFAGLPAVVSNVGGLPEIVEHNYNGFLIDHHEVHEFIYYLELLIHNGPLRQTMGENAKEKAYSKFNEEDIVDKINTLYLQLLS